MIQTANAPPWITTACAALFLTSGSSLPTKRNMRLPIGGNRAQARIVYRFLLPPTALGEPPPIGAGWLGGGGGICDIDHSPPVGCLLRARLSAQRRQNAIPDSGPNDSGRLAQR